MSRAGSLLAASLLPFLFACDSAPLTSPVPNATRGSAPAVAERSAPRSVIMHDICDPTTFNEAVGPGTCVRSGGMKFDQFITQLTRRGFVQGYDFSPPSFNVSPGQAIVARNNGGEVHTFTQVAAFGGGIVPLLNQLSGNPVVAPECTALSLADFVASGASFTTSVSGPGTVLFQCCIHPWMRAVVSAS